MDIVIRVAAELVNLLTPGQDRGRRYVTPEGDERTAAVGAVLRGAGAREATWEEAAELCFVAAELRGVFEAVSTGDTHGIRSTARQKFLRGKFAWKNSARRARLNSLPAKTTYPRPSWRLRGRC